MDIRSPVYALDRGLDLVVDGDPGLALLPPQQRLVPSEFGHVPELQRLLTQASLDAALDEIVRPSVSDRQLLSPTSFRSALADAEATLRERAAERPESAKVLNRCARQLNELGTLYGLLSQYRNSLLQG